MIPGLTTTERAEANGLTFRAQLELERREPWVAHWSARFDAGAARLRAWLDAGRPAADRAQLCIVGDRSIVAVVRDVVARLPEPVAHHLVAHAVVFCAGVETSGWCGRDMPPVPTEPQPIALATTDAGIVAHELAHAWHLRPSSATTGLSAAQREQLVDAVRVVTASDDRAADLVEHHMQRERAADALATALGFPCDTTSGYRGERRRRRLHEQLVHRSGR